MSITAEDSPVGYALERHQMSAAEFLAWDAGQTIRHEFVRGEVFMMTGGADRNNTVALNIVMALREHLRGSPCRVYASDVKLRVEATDCYFYPDVMVTCSKVDLGDRLIKRDPMLVVEVLSPSTAAFDRGEKFGDYRALPGLAEYLLVDVDRQRCDLYRQGADKLWVLHPTASGEGVHLSSVDLTIAGDVLWADLEPDLEDAGASAG